MQLAEWMADQARGADLLLIAPEPSGVGSESTRRIDIGDLVMRIGRPMVVVPPNVEALDLEHVVVGWKDTKETRRAVLDALPLLRSAGHVTVMEIVEDAADVALARRHLADVVAWLEGHGFAAEAIAEPLSSSAVAQLEEAAAAKKAGLLVIGAYAHNRLREWVLGGMTRDALRHPARCSLMSQFAHVALIPASPHWVVDRCIDGILAVISRIRIVASQNGSAPAQFSAGRIQPVGLRQPPNSSKARQHVNR